MIAVSLSLRPRPLEWRLPPDVVYKQTRHWDIFKFPLANGSVSLPRHLLARIEDRKPRIEAWETSWFDGDDKSINKVQLVTDREGRIAVPFTIPRRANLPDDGGQMLRVAGFSYLDLVLVTLDKDDKLSIVEYRINRFDEIVRVPQRVLFKSALREFEVAPIPDFCNVVDAAKEKLAGGDPWKVCYAEIGDVNRF